MTFAVRVSSSSGPIAPDALERLRSGDYGICEACASRPPRPPGHPQVTTCVNVQDAEDAAPAWLRGAGAPLTRAARRPLPCAGARAA